jgi:hypothetical protein
LPSCDEAPDVPGLIEVTAGASAGDGDIAGSAMVKNRRCCGNPPTSNCRVQQVRGVEFAIVGDEDDLFCFSDVAHRQVGRERQKREILKATTDKSEYLPEIGRGVGLHALFEMFAMSIGIGVSYADLHRYSPGEFAIGCVG